MLRWECRLEIPLDHLWTMFRDPVIRIKWEEVLSKFEVVQEGIEEGQDVIYYVVKTPFGVRNRDFVCVRGSSDKIEGYDKVGFMIGTTHDAKPEESGQIRGNIEIGASFFKSNEDGSTNCTIYTKSDPKVSSLEYLSVN